jgi:putative tryptophan/tyrosine transport system substrate-binding protein
MTTAQDVPQLRETKIAAALIGVLIDQDNPDAAAETADMQNAATAIGRRIVILKANSDAAIDAAFTTLVAQRAGALYLGTGTLFFDRHSRIDALAERYRIPVIYQNRDGPQAGGLMSYGTSLAEAWRQVGIYTARILKGEKPADLPVMQSSKFEFVINLKTAKSLGLTVPATLLARADDVIE